MVDLVVMQRYRAADADSVTRALQAVFGDGSAMVPSEDGLQYEQTSLVDDGISVTHITSSGAPVQVAVRAVPDLVVLFVRSGTLTLRQGGEGATITRGGLALLPLLQSADIAWHEVAFDAFSFPASTVRRLMGSRTWTPQLHAARTLATSEELKGLWRRSASTLANEVLRKPQLFESDLIRDQAIGAVLASTIEAFGLSNQRDDRSDSDAWVVRQADAYMSDHLDESISIGEIALQLGVSIRALQLAFQRTGNNTPLLRLRHKRMTAAHAALTRERPDTVAEIARRVGYTNLGRFSSHYRQAFDEFPSQTLRDALNNRTQSHQNDLAETP